MEEGEEEVQLCLSLAAEKEQHAQCAEYKRGINGLSNPLYEAGRHGVAARFAERVWHWGYCGTCRENFFIIPIAKDNWSDGEEKVGERNPHRRATPACRDTTEPAEPEARKS